MPEEQRRQVIPQLIEKFPQFAPAWLEFATLATEPRERLARIEAGLRAQPGPETSGMLRLNQAQALRHLGAETAANEDRVAYRAQPAVADGGQPRRQRLSSGGRQRAE